MSKSQIVVRGAREHNLKNIDVAIPRERLIVITGLSGSGKSSLAFDTLYAEGRRRYVESLSSYARQFLGQMKKPEVEHVEGLSPAISIDQKTVHRNPRSTVGTVTEIYDYLRLLFAHVGRAHCPQCGDRIAKQSPQEIVDLVMALPAGTKAQVLAPIVRGRKGTYQRMFKDLLGKGYARARVNGVVVAVEDPPELARYEKHTIEAIVDRIVVKPEARSRIQESIEQALKDGEGLCIIETVEGKKTKDLLFSEQFACPRCATSLPEIVPRVFSFNSPHGACDACSGLGFSLQVDEAKVVVDPSLPMQKGAIHHRAWRINPWTHKWLRRVAREKTVDLSKPFGKLPKGYRELVLYGTEDHGGSPATRRYANGYDWEGIIPRMERLFHASESVNMKASIQAFQRETPCKKCSGDRLRPEVLGVRIEDKNIMQVTRLAVADAVSWFEALPGLLSEQENRIAHEVVKEIRARLGFLKDVGLGYLSLDRASGTLSGGEAQRIRLATQIGSGLVGVLYILDEPSIGLHQRDNKRLLATLQHLRDVGNTVIVVEHDEETMWAADHIVDLGPGAGRLGGTIVAEGTPQEVAATLGSITGDYLSGRRAIAVPATRRDGGGRGALTVRGARANNLKGIDVSFPLGKFIAVTGVSGSGKSSLVNEVLVKGAQARLGVGGEIPGPHDDITGLEHIDKLVVIDQSPIGRTPRSNPATYTGLFTPIRDLFARTQESKKRGYAPGRFSFNVKGGRCEACTGDGIVKIEMHFLPDVYVPCEVCKGARYMEETLQVRYKDQNIKEVLDMSVDEALKFFQNIPAIRSKLQTLHDVGLGYIHLGQPATTLSGGEAQRVKLATELSKRATGRTLYVLDEPTTGLHAHDMTYLLAVLNRLADSGNTVVVIEHNLDVVKTADHVIDLGPEGGEAGGRVVATGSPEELARTKTWTGRYLKEVLERHTLVDEDVKRGERALLGPAVAG